MILVLFSMELFASSVVIPYNAKKKPAVDLVNADGDVIDADTAFEMERQGADLSLLNPEESDIWCKNCAVPPVIFPDASSTNFLSYKPSISGMFRFNLEKDG